MIMIVKTPGSQMGSPAAVEGGGEARGGGRGEERNGVSGKFKFGNLASSSSISSAAKIPKSVGERRLPSRRPQLMGSSLLAGMREWRTRMRTRLEFSRKSFHIFPLMLLSLRIIAAKSLSVYARVGCGVVDEEAIAGQAFLSSLLYNGNQRIDLRSRAIIYALP